MTRTWRAHSIAKTIGTGLIAALMLTPITAVAPVFAAEGAVSDAVFEWSLNDESGGGAFFGGCNFLSAGVAGDTGSARLWTEADGFYTTSEGNTSIVKIAEDGREATPTWADKCKTVDGVPVTTGNPALTSGNTVRITDGAGTVDPDAGTA
ncbi:hypothetical protein GCM10027416_04800 [Okibacterium endophyticum]